MNKEVTITLENISPEIAKCYLERNVRNRKINDKLVDFYASEMINGRWRCAVGAAITFDWNGDLQDGQHRLKAVVQSGCTIQLYVKRGANPEDFPYLDTGKIRGAFDTFYISEIPNAQDITAAIKKYLLLKENRSAIHDTMGSSSFQASKGYKSVFTPKFFLSVYEKNPDFWQEVAKFSKRINKTSKLLNRSFISGLYAYLVLEKANDANLVSRFFEELTGRTLNEGLTKLRNALIDDMRKPSYLRMTNKYKQKLIAYVWNHFRAGKRLRSIRFDGNITIDFD